MSNDVKSVWYTRCPAPTPLSLAAQLGWVETAFDTHGVSVASIRDSKDPAVRQSHYTHALDFSFRQGGSIPPIWARSGGRETRVVGITTTDEFQAIIALPSSGVASARDLKGRKVGVPRSAAGVVDFQRATALKGIVSALSLEGLTVQDVELIYLDGRQAELLEVKSPSFLGLNRRYPYGEELLALARGEIDAFFVKGAEGLVLANQIGATIVSEFGFHPDAKVRINNGTPRPLTVDVKFAEERPDLVQELVATVCRISDWAEANPNDAVRLIAQEIGVSEDAVWAANGPDVHKHLRLTVDSEQIEAISHFKNFLLEWGFISADFDVAGWIDSSALEAVQRRQAA